MTTLSPFWRAGVHVPRYSGGILRSIYLSGGETSWAQFIQGIIKVAMFIFLENIYPVTVEHLPRYCNNVLIDCSGVSSARAQQKPFIDQSFIVCKLGESFLCHFPDIQIDRYFNRILRPSSMTICCLSAEKNGAPSRVKAGPFIKFIWF